MAANPETAERGRVNPLRAAAEWLDWKINPVLHRDLRLYTRGRLMIVSYIITLTGLTLLAVMFAFIAKYEGTDGETLLRIITGILAVACGAFIPNLVFERFRAELGNRATELALMSPLSPARLVRGKLMAAWCVSLLVISIASPMIATAYMLGGVNLLAIAGQVAGVVLAAAVMPTLQLFMATQRRGKSVSRVASSIAFIVQFFVMIWYAGFLGEAFGARRYGDEMRLILACVAVAAVLIAQFLYFVTVGRLEGEAANRDAKPRISLAVAAYLGGALAMGLIQYFKGTIGRGSGPDFWELLLLVACFVSYTFCIGFLIISYTNPTPARGVLERWKGRGGAGLFLLPGLKSLTRYFFLNAAIILGCVLLGLWCNWDDDDSYWRFACFSMAPFMAITIGLAAYYHVSLRLFKDKRNPNLLPMTIIAANIGAAFLAGILAVVVSYAVDIDSVYCLIQGAYPVGLVVGGGGSWRLVDDIGKCGIFFLVVYGALLVPILFANMNRRLGMPAEGEHEPR